jgi:8-oxo-dGTP pyrophosphatase MutT (NUDIX family)
MHTPTFTHAGGIVLRFPGTSEPLVLVVRPSTWRPDASNPGALGEWLLPKGHIEPGEETVEAAVREVAEEAKMGCSAPRFVGYVSYTLPHEEVACAFYLMNEEGPVPSEEDRPTAWLTLAELEEAMPYRTTLALVERAIAMAKP